MSELHQRNIEQQTRVWSVPHLDQNLAHLLHRANDGGGAHAHRLIGNLRGALVGQLHQLGGHQRQETVAQVANDVLGKRAWVTALLHSKGKRGQRLARIVSDERFDELVVGQRVGHVATRRRHELERAQRVAGRTAALGEHGLQRFFGNREASIGGNPTNVLFEFVHWQQVEFEMLHA